MTSQFRIWPKLWKGKSEYFKFDFFTVLRCISNQKINEYWQISIWFSQLALCNSCVKWYDLDFNFDSSTFLSYMVLILVFDGLFPPGIVSLIQSRLFVIVWHRFSGTGWRVGQAAWTCPREWHLLMEGVWLYVKFFRQHCWTSVATNVTLVSVICPSVILVLTLTLNGRSSCKRHFRLGVEVMMHRG